MEHEEGAGIQFYHLNVLAGRPASQENLSREKVLRSAVVPYRLRRAFFVNGYEIQPRDIKRFKIRRTSSPVDAAKAMGELDTSTFAGAVASMVKISAKLDEGEDVTADLIAEADQIIETERLAPPPVSFPSEEIDPKKVFVVMSFAPELEENFEAIARTCREFGLNAVRADKEISSAAIVDRIQRHLRESALVIADLTNARPNVYYEIGYFDAILQARGSSSEQQLLFVAKDISTDAHFDLRHRGIEAYDGAFALLKIVETWFEARGLVRTSRVR